MGWALFLGPLSPHQPSLGLPPHLRTSTITDSNSRGPWHEKPGGHCGFSLRASLLTAKALGSGLHLSSLTEGTRTIRLVQELGRQGRHNSFWAHRTLIGQPGKRKRCCLGLGKILQSCDASWVRCRCQLGPGRRLCIIP